MTEPELLYNGRWLRLMRRGHWEYVERAHAGGGAVVVIALTAQDRILFVEQFRAAIQCKTIEMPAGLVGDDVGRAHEGVLEAARRELLEEAGYRCERVEYCMAGPSSAGMSSESIAFVRAYGLTREHAGGGDHTENIVVHEIPRSDAPHWLMRKQREGYSIDPKVFAGLYFLDHGPALLGAG